MPSTTTRAADMPPGLDPLAACADTDPDLWFRFDGEQAAAWTLRAREARVICAGCPIRPGCLRWALETGESEGVWGGLDEEERRALLRRRLLGVRVA